MANDYDTLCYHGRRAVDELAGAASAANAAAALVHRELSLLHMDRFVKLMTTAAETIHTACFSPPASLDERLQRT